MTQDALDILAIFVIVLGLNMIAILTFQENMKMKTLGIITFAFLLAFALSACASPAKADGQIVLSAEAGMAFMGPSGLATVGPLERDEIATTQVQNVSIGYQMPAYGGHVRGLLGYEKLNADGDWGVNDAGATARQTVDVLTTSFVLGAEYDFLQVKAGAFYPFVGAGVRLNINRPVHGAIINHADGSQTGCVGDDADTTSFGWHGLVGAGADFAQGWTARVFYQYTDHGNAKMTGDNCPSWHGRSIAPHNVNVRSHSARVRFSYSF